MNWKIHFLAIVILMMASCSKQQEVITLQKPSLLDSPSIKQTAQTPNLFVSSTGQTILSWLEGNDSTGHQLQYATLEGNNWSVPQTIAQGKNWFANWADFPSVIMHSDGTMAAHWLAMRDTGTYDYDIYISQKDTQSSTWNKPFIPHRDSLAAEHGFTSMLPLNNGKTLAIWLDGRNTKSMGSHDSHGTGAGAMTLRSAEFDTKGTLSRELLIDDRVCDCCQTDVALTAKGAIAVYRNRSKEEIRDIAYTLYKDGKWLTPKVIHPDQWKIAGCPVNGPAVSALNDQVAVAWYTGANGDASVRVALSKNAGETFNPAITIASNQVLGRVDVECLNKDFAVVSWLAKSGDQAVIKSRLISSSGQLYPENIIGETSTSRSSGFPIMVKTGSNLLFAWASPQEAPYIKTVKVPID